MALKQTGLNNPGGQGAGNTTNFSLFYEDSLPNQARVKATANTLLAVVETEFSVTTGPGWFNTPAGKFGSGNRQVVNVNQADNSGASNNGYPSAINLDAQSGNGNAANAAARVENLFMAEWVEILMSIAGNWNAGDSSGEGLSQFSSIQRFPTGHYSYYGSFVDGWLNGTGPAWSSNNKKFIPSPNTARSDWVNTTFTGQKVGPDQINGDGDQISFGCALAFLWYLNTQLGFSINQIIASYNSNLTSIYKKLTSDAGDPFPFFKALLDAALPPGATASVGALPNRANADNPFPLALMSFWVDKNTFGKDEVQDAINTNGGIWPKAFWLVINGFSENSFNSLGVTIPAPIGTFANLNGISISQNPDIDFENAANPQAPQRIRIPFDITFSNAALTDFPPSGTSTFDLNAFLTVGGNKVPGSDASTQFELVAGSDPYFTNIDPNQNNVWYLSQDLRVFTSTPAKTNVPVAGGPTFANDNVEGAFSYVRSLLSWLNSNYSNPSGTDPFNSLLPGQTGSFQDDSSVTPLTVDFSNPFLPKLDNNYNFAIARVRLRGIPGSTAANSVSVFFRLWSTETADTDFQSDTYPTTPDGSRPAVGADHRTLPFFAASDRSDYNSGATNDFNIPLTTTDSIWAYFGCFLNLYDSSNVIDGKSVQAWLNGTHHCIVAQIAYGGTPIGTGDTPVSSDKLAQRNLQITRSDNPGGPETHRIPQTFDVRPSANSGGTNYPDELMIDWGAIPVGSVASIYWPQVLAADVITLAAQLYSSHTLSASDANTIQCKVTGGVTYIPIPTGGTESFAGLFTVQLPTTVVAGQEFSILVRRISSQTAPSPVIIQAPETHSPPSTMAKGPKAKAKAVKPAAQAVAAVQQIPPGTWRYVVGTFQVRIPVSDATTILPQEQNTLAIMKWRLQHMAPASRWYPVLQRYISYISDRISGLGGDPNAIPPSLSGAPITASGEEKGQSYTGKICEVIFDCFGDFEGFILESCCERHSFKSCEKGIAELVVRACRERVVLTVTVGPPPRHRIREIVMRCCC